MLYISALVFGVFARNWRGGWEVERLWRSASSQKGTQHEYSYCIFRRKKFLEIRYFIRIHDEKNHLDQYHTAQISYFNSECCWKIKFLNTNNKNLVFHQLF